MADKKAPPDLTKYDELQKNQEAGVDVAIKDPRGEDLGFTIRVAGPDSERQKKAIEAVRDERIASENMNLTAEEIARGNLKALAMSVISWSPFQLDGAEYVYTVDNAMKLFNRLPWIREQVEAKAGRRAAFFAASETAQSADTSEG